MTQIKIETQSVDAVRADAVVLFLFEKELSDAGKAIDKKLNGRISSLIRKKQYSPKKLALRAVDTVGGLKADTVLLVGLGAKKDFSVEVLRRAAAKGAVGLRARGAKSFAFSIEDLADRKNDAATLAQAAVEGIILSQYTFTAYKQKKGDSGDKAISHAIMSHKKDTARIKRVVADVQKVCKAVFLARDLGNHPGNTATPTFLADTARRECKKVGVRCRVLGRSDMERLKMGALLAVAKGSAQPPKFIIMEHMKGPKGEKPVVLVGKGLTFDSGGISIKPSSGMEEMKYDMCGGAAVIGTMVAVGLLKMKKNVVGLVPSTENMPGGRANKPGDIITGMSGQTIEVLNTDAEGRLILSDALHYAKRYKPSAVIDIATLTGACMVALGHLASGLFGNDEKLIDAVRASGERTGERCWPLPLWEEYDEQIKSKFADVQNIGNRYGGAITAAAFLKKFTDYKWAHLDIAGSAFSTKSPAPYVPAGGAGLGVRQFIDFLQNHR